MLKKILIAAGVGLGVWLLTSNAPLRGFSQGVVELPPQLSAILVAGIFFAVNLALEGRIPGPYIEEISGAISTAVLGVLAVALRLIPPEFEQIAIAILNLLVVILGVVVVVKGLFAGAQRAYVRLALRG